MLNRERKGEIAYLFLKEVIRKKGIGSLSSNEFRREIGNEAKKINMPKEEVFEFVELIIRELVNEMFSDNNNTKE